MNIEQHLTIATLVVNLFYNQFSIFGYRIGLYPLFALVPGMGDAISIFISVYLIWIAKELHLPATQQAKMYGNILFDLVVGAIPVVGDLTDTVFRAHVRNLKIISDYAHDHVMDGQVIKAQIAST